MDTKRRGRGPKKGTKRYAITQPIPGGYAWWNVIDRNSQLYYGYANFTVATFSIHCPDAEKHARELAARLNGETT